MNPAQKQVESFFNHFFPLIPGTKRPRIPNWQFVPAAEDHSDDHGIALQITELVLDFDPKYYPPDPFTGKGKLKLEAEIISEWKLPRTRIVRTPSGGRHLYYTIPLADQHVKFEQPGYGAMINFLTRGRYVAGAGTVTAEGIYVLEDDSPIAELPAEFYAWLQKVSDNPNERAAVDGIEADDPRAVMKYEAWLASAAPPAISGQSGDDTTLKVAMQGRDYGLTMEMTATLMWNVYNRRCNPPWFESELERKVQNAYRYAKGKQGSKSPQKLIDNDPLLLAAAPVETTAVKKMKALRHHHLVKDFVLDEKQKLVKNNIVNARLILTHDQHFKDLLWWDSFRNCVRMSHQAWWRDDPSDELSEQDFLHIYDWMNGTKHATTSAQYQCTLQTVKHAVILVAQQNAKHPLQDWLNGLKWDGVPRLERLLIDTCGAPDDKWSRAAIRKFMIGLVERAYEPGSKFDYILCLQGTQGIRKGMWIDELGKPWVRCGALDPGDKDLDHKMLGTWLMELAEIDQGHQRRDKAKIKDFITRKSDFYRKPYAPAPTDVPRTACFIGTLNPTEIGWLEDLTGHRRFWPVDVEDCDPALLAQLKEMAFAEAVEYYRKGEKPYFERDSEEEDLALAAQAKNRVMSPWGQLLRPKLKDVGKVTSEDIYALLGIADRDVNSVVRTKVYHALTDLQFKFDRLTQVWTKFDLS